MDSNETACAWVAIPEGANLARARTRENHPYNFGYVPAMARLISAHSSIGPAFGALFGSVMFAPGALRRDEREMVAAVAAVAQDCHY